jgi:archaellum biogenesis protein FlaJ (TadC family)
MWTGITGDETLLVAVKTASSADTIILVAVMGVLSTIIPGLKKPQLGVSGEVKKRVGYTVIKLPLLPLSIVLVSTFTRPWAP